MNKEPSPPSAPEYVISPLKRQGAELLESIGQYCFDLAEYKRHKAWEEVDTEEVPDEAQEKLKESSGPVLQEEKVSCGKDSCSKCPHGPYLYKYERQNGKVVSKYVGKPE